MRHAQEQAFFQLATRRGLLPADARQRVAGHREQHGAALPLDEVLVRQGLLGGEVVEQLLEKLRGAQYRCEPCGRALSWQEVGALPRLRCPGCEGPLKRKAARPGRKRKASSLTKWTMAALLAGHDNGEERRLGPYLVLEELGRGCNGIVFRARRPGLERQYALKVLTEDLDEEGVQRFRLEAQVASKLDHRGIVSVFDVGRAEGQHYYAMEYCPGETLAGRLRREGRLEPAVAASLVAELAEAIHYAHQRSVVHRDLKPANVILEQGSGRARVTDFGLARDRSLMNRLTQEGRAVGTPYYMAPEQFRGEDVDARADVYALGVIFYECLTGQRPFEGSTAIEVSDKVMDGEFAAPTELEPSIPPSLEMICLCAMAYEPADRYLSAEAFAEDLAAFARGEAPSHASGILAGPPPVSRLPGLLAGSLAGLLLAGSAGGIAWLEARDTRVLAALGRVPGNAGSTRPSGQDPARPTPAVAPAEQLQELLAEAQGRAREREPLEAVLAVFEQAEELAGPAERAPVRLARAAYLLRRGRWARAEVIAQELEAIAGETGLEARRLRAQALEGQGRPEAHPLYEELARLDPAGAHGLAAFAAARRMARQHQGAREAAEQALELAPGDPTVLVEAGLQRALDPRADSLELAQRGLRRTPHCPRLLFLEGLIRARRNEVPAAYERVEEAIALTEPQSPWEALLLRGTLQLRRGRASLAVTDLDRVLATQPENGEALLRRGFAHWALAAEAHEDLRLVARAEEDWRRSYELDPDTFERMTHGLRPDMRAHVHAVVGLTRGEAPPQDAWTVLGPALAQRLERRARRAQPPGREALLEALRSAALGGSYAQADALYGRAAAAAPDCPAIALERARFHVGREAPVAGRTSLARARELGSPELELLRLETRLAELEKRGPEARRLLTERDPAGADGLWARAVAASIAGNLDPAMGFLQQVLDRAPEHSDALFLQAAIASQQGRFQEALAGTTRLLELNGAIDLRVPLLRLGCLRELLIRDGDESGRPAMRVATLAPLFGAYESLFSLTPGPRVHLRAAELALLVQGAHPWRSSIARWLRAALQRDSTCGQAYLHLARFELMAGGPRDTVLDALHRAGEAQPGLRYPPGLLEEYRLRFGPDCPELEAFGSVPQQESAQEF